MSDKLLLSIPETMELTGLGRSLLVEKLLRGEIGSVKVGRRRLVPRTAIEAYVAGLIRDQIEPAQVAVEAGQEVAI